MRPVMRTKSLGRFAVGAVLSLTAGCVGNIGDGDGKGDHGGSDDPALDVASAPIRRMTPDQYVNSVQDLLGDAALELDLDDDGGEVFTRLGAEKLNAAVETIASREASWTTTVFPCDVTGADDDACVDSFIEDFGYRAFRRPLFTEEVSWLKGVYTATRAEQSFHDSMMTTLEVMLQAPQFFYFLEEGVDGDADLPAGVRPLGGFERATRLSYFIADSTPDDELLAAAQRGDLDTAEGVRAQASRLVASPRAKGIFKKFFTGVLELDGNAKHASLEDSMRTPEDFALDSPELRTSMRSELDALVDRIVYEDKLRMQDLFTTNEAYVDANLAALYGVDAPSGGAGWVTLPKERAGLLTRAAFLTLYARGDVKSPIRRAAFIVKNLLCYDLGDPPPNANDVTVTGGTVDDGGNAVRRTVRMDVEAKTSAQGCIDCHQIINPTGFTFDNFDALGQYVTEEHGEDDQGAYDLPIDASGSVPIIDADGSMTGATPVDGPVAASQALASSPALAHCMAKKWFDLALHRLPADEDASSIAKLEKSFGGTAPLADVVLEAATSDAFLYLRKESAQ